MAALVMATQCQTEELRVVLIRPSKFDDEGFVIRSWRGVLPSNTSDVLRGLTEDVRQRQSLGNIRILIRSFDDTIERVPVKKIIRWNQRPGIKLVVCLVGVQTNQFPRAFDLGKQFRSAGISVLMGGFHVSGSINVLGEDEPEIQALFQAGITVVSGEVEGEWENILHDCVDGTLKPLYSLAKDLRSLPEIREAPMPVIDSRILSHHVFKFATLDTSRGCPHSCSFCTIIHVQGHKMRSRSPERIARLIRSNFKQHGITFYFFTDDNLARNQEWPTIFEALIQLRHEGIPVKFMMQVDLQSHTIPGFIAKARQAGCTQVFLGMESLNPANLVKAGKKHNHVGEYAKLVSAWRKHEIATHVAYIIGFDGDTVQSVSADLQRLINEVRPDQASFFMMTPLPGSADHARWREEGRALSLDLNEFDSTHAAMWHPNMTAKGWLAISQEAWERFYSFENMRAILKHVSDRNYFSVLKNFLWYRSAILDGQHPMIAGLFRKKSRTDRRPGFPIESRWCHFRRRTKEICQTARIWWHLYLEMQELWLQTWPERADRLQIARRRLVPWSRVWRKLPVPIHWHGFAFGLLARILLIRPNILTTGKLRLDVHLPEQLRLHSPIRLHQFWIGFWKYLLTFRWWRIRVGETIRNTIRTLRVHVIFCLYWIYSKRIEERT